MPLNYRARDFFEDTCGTESMARTRGHMHTCIARATPRFPLRAHRRAAPAGRFTRPVHPARSPGQVPLASTVSPVTGSTGQCSVTRRPCHDPRTVHPASTVPPHDLRTVYPQTMSWFIRQTMSWCTVWPHAPPAAACRPCHGLRRRPMTMPSSGRPCHALLADHAMICSQTMP